MVEEDDMWQCQNCGYSDDSGSTFDEEVDADSPEESVRYCPECGSDEVFLVDEDEDDDEDDSDDSDDEDDIVVADIVDDDLSTGDVDEDDDSW